MELTRDFKETVKERAGRDPAFARAILDEAAALFLNGEQQIIQDREHLNDFTGLDPHDG